jgi:Calpain large subunit, domain III
MTSDPQRLAAPKMIGNFGFLRFHFFPWKKRQRHDAQKPLDVTNHSVAREVVTFFTLPPGDYVVVPQTSVPHCEGKFLLRIFTDEHSNIW